MLSILVDKGIERGSELLVTTEAPTADGRPFVVETPSARIAGRVVDAAGAGVAGVQVRIECEGLLLPGTQLAMRFAFDVTADDGRFAFELLPPGTYRVSAGGQAYVEGAPARPRHGLATLRDVALASGEDRSDFVLVTDEPRTVEGSVVDANGRPVVGASIHVRTAAGVFAHELALVHSDAQGQFRYEGLPPGALAFGALADGWASADLVAEQDGRVRLELVPSGRLVVEFHCPQGGILSLRGEDGDELAGRGDVRRLAGEERLRWRSDAIEFDDLAPGRYAVELRPFGTTTSQTKYVQVAAGEERRVVLTAR
jgi:protocatechuate 3,4-dioxygenase beta subunit